MAVRYDDDLLAEIRRTVKNYQAKRTRILNRGGEIVPDPSSVSHFLNDYTDRRQLLRDLKSLQRFSVRGSENIVELESGIRLTEYQIGEIKRERALAKRRITMQLKEKPEGVLQPLTASYYDTLQSRYDYLSRPIGSLSKRQFQIFRRITENETDLERKNRILHENVLTMIDTMSYGIDPKVAKELKSKLAGLSDSKLAKLIQTDPYFESIILFYEVQQQGGEMDNMEDKFINLIDRVDEV